MTLVALAAAAVTALAAGQSSDAYAYQVYQSRLDTLVGAGRPASTGDAVRVATNATAAAPSGCALAPGAGNLFTTSDCAACHVGYATRHSHPVDVYQDSARSRSLRSSAEVVKRGVFLADGKVTCLSCHDGNSSWKYKLAIPADASLRPRVKPGRVETYAMPVAMRTAATMPAGSDVSPTPLCRACHAFD